MRDLHQAKIRHPSKCNGYTFSTKVLVRVVAVLYNTTMKRIPALFLITFLSLGFPFALAFQSPSGYDSRGADYEILKQLAKIEQHLVDIEKRIDIHRQEIDALSVAPVHEGERIKGLEDSRDRQEADTKAWRDRADNWLRGIFLLAISGFSAWAIRLWKDKRRHKVNKEQMDALSLKTDGMSERLEASAKTIGHQEGRDEAIKEERILHPKG